MGGGVGSRAVSQAEAMVNCAGMYGIYRVHGYKSCF